VTKTINLSKDTQDKDKWSDNQEDMELKQTGEEQQESPPEHKKEEEQQTKEQEQQKKEQMQTQKETSKTQVLMVTTYNLDAKEQEMDQPKKVSHYDWNQIHNNWLNDMMKEQLGETEDIGQLKLPNIITALQPQQTRKRHPAPTRAFGVRYNV